MSLAAFITKDLQAAATIGKTGETLIDAEILCGAYSFLTLHFTYTKGDETGLDIYPYILYDSGSITPAPDQDWDAAAGTRTSTTNKYEVTATGNYVITFDVRGVEIMKFYQGGSNNDGTPTGTLAASYTLTSA